MAGTGINRTLARLLIISAFAAGMAAWKPPLTDLAKHSVNAGTVPALPAGFNIWRFASGHEDVFYRMIFVGSDAANSYPAQVGNFYSGANPCPCIRRLWSEN
jgi:hypothetical protein